MKDKKETSPPRWAQRLLTWYCKPDLLEDLEGDLQEYFVRNVKAKGLRRARWIYIADVLKFFRLYTIRKPTFINLFIQWIMIRSYIKTSGRNIVRNKLFSGINIIGLAVSMSVGLVMISVLMDIRSYDRFNEHYGSIHRVVSRYQFLEDKDNGFMATTSLKAGKAIQESFPGQEGVAVLRRNFSGDMQYGEKKLPFSGFWANEGFFKVFTFPLVAGNPATALKQPYSVVLTETIAQKFFGDENPMGKSMVLNDGAAYTITGIARDIPKFSHLKFEMLGSLSTREVTEKDNVYEMAWDNIWNTWVYVLMPENADLQAFQQNLSALSVREDPSVKNTHIELRLQPLSDIITGEDLGNQIGATMGKTIMFVFSGLTFVVILSACFNYTNLSVARALRRSREVGIRKVIGALRLHVITQFVLEAVMISLLALAGAFVIFLIVRPHFISMESSLQKLLVLEVSPLLVVSFIGFAIFIGVVAGIFPALFFSKINAAKVLKNITSVHGFQKLTMRKVLIVFQYSLSLMLITGTVIIYQQYKHYLAFDLGFNTENVFNIRLQGNKAAVFEKELNELPEVKAISHSVMISSTGNYWGSNVRNPNNPDDSTFVYANKVDERYIPLHGHQIIAGKNFSPQADSAIESQLIVDEHTLKRFNLAKKNPADAVGEVLKVDGKMLHIVGVMRNFEYSKPTNNTSKETMFRYSPTEVEFLNVKILSDDLPATREKIEALWKKMDNVHTFDGKFFDEQIEEAYKGFSASVRLAGFISFLCICISSLGLLGMVVFTTETRLKEVSIRKVLGASEGKLVYLLSRGFIILLVISSCIALPITYLVFEHLILTNVANHAVLTVSGGVISIIVVMSLALIMIGSQTLKIARTNPAQILKSE